MMTEELEVLESFNHRIREIWHYHERFRHFAPGDDDGAATYGVIMRSQVQDLLRILDSADRIVRTQRNLEQTRSACP